MAPSENLPLKRLVSHLSAEGYPPASERTSSNKPGAAFAPPPSAAESPKGDFLARGGFSPQMTMRRLSAAHVFERLPGSRKNSSPATPERPRLSGA